MRYVVIDPEKQTTRAIEASGFDVALDVARLGSVGRDHAVAAPGIAIVVFEFGLYMSPTEQHYFALGRRLYAGTALLYAFDEGGNTVDLTRNPVPRFFKSPAEIEAAISSGEIERPTHVLNNE